MQYIIKKISPLLFLLFITLAASAQKKDIVRERMIEFIEQRVEIGEAESKKFKLVFRDYFAQWQQVVREYHEDRLLQQQKVLDLQINYRNKLKEFLPIRKCNAVYENQRIFLKQLRKIRKARHGPYRKAANAS